MMMTTAASTMPKYSCGETQGHGHQPRQPHPEFCGIWEGSIASTGACICASDPKVLEGLCLSLSYLCVCPPVCV